MISFIQKIFLVTLECIRAILKMNHREISKKYSELLNRAEFANGRKEVVGLLKKAAKLKSQFEINY